MLGELLVKPGENHVRIDVVVEARQKIAEHQSLLAGAMSRYPEPAIAEIIVDEKDIAFLEPENGPNVSVFASRVRRQEARALERNRPQVTNELQR